MTGSFSRPAGNEIFCFFWSEITALWSICILQTMWIWQEGGFTLWRAFAVKNRKADCFGECFLLRSGRYTERESLTPGRVARMRSG